MAFHPNFSTNHKFYRELHHGRWRPADHHSEFQTWPTDPNTADPNSERVLLLVHQPFPNHKGGQLVFGPDGFLYIGLGDGGSGGDPQNNAQNLSSFLGKMLRIDVDPPFATGKEYAIPADNPFAGGGGLPEIYAYGLRNPWRFSFEPVTNRMFVADVGQDSFEEIDIMQKGGNFGWRVMEGTHCFNPATGCDTSNKILPIFEYPHTDGIAVIGGYIYKGTAIPSLANKYIFADLTGKIWSLTEAPANTWTRGDLLATNLTLTSFGRDAAGELYLVDYNGNILKLVCSRRGRPLCANHERIAGTISSSMTHDNRTSAWPWSSPRRQPVFFWSRSLATRSASRSFSAEQSEWPSSCRTARSKRPLRLACHVSMSSETRPDGPSISASSKNVVLASSAVSAGTPGLRSRACKISLQFSERTSTHVQSPRSDAG